MLLGLVQGGCKAGLGLDNYFAIWKFQLLGIADESMTKLCTVLHEITCYETIAFVVSSWKYIKFFFAIMFITRQRLHVFCDNKNTAATARGLWLIIQINHHLSLFKPEPETDWSRLRLRQTKQILLLADLQWARIKTDIWTVAWTLFYATSL